MAFNGSSTCSQFIVTVEYEFLLVRWSWCWMSIECIQNGCTEINACGARMCNVHAMSVSFDLTVSGRATWPVCIYHFNVWQSSRCHRHRRFHRSHTYPQNAPLWSHAICMHSQSAYKMKMIPHSRTPHTLWCNSFRIILSERDMRKRASRHWRVVMTCSCQADYVKRVWLTRHSLPASRRCLNVCVVRQRHREWLPSRHGCRPKRRYRA